MEKAKEQIIAQLRAWRSDDVIAALISFLPPAFSSDSETLHKKIQELRERDEYHELLKDFIFVARYPFDYSPLLERILKRLQQSKLLAARNPGYQVYEVTEGTRKAIKKEILAEFNINEQKKLETMAKELEGALQGH